MHRLTTCYEQVNEQALVRALTQRTLSTRGESVTSPMNFEQANDVRDAYIKVDDAIGS